jgi:sugar lactone lactonase YvrE
MSRLREAANDRRAVREMGPGSASRMPAVAPPSLIVAGDTDLVRLDSEHMVQGRSAVEDPDCGRCLNDAACDAAGRLWIGSAVLEGKPASVGLYREGCGWVAIWGAGEIRCFDPDGCPLARVRTPRAAADHPRLRRDRLASPASDFTSGQVFTVDGGATFG